MTNKELRRKIKKFEGPVYAGVILRDDVIYVKVVKADLLFQLKDGSDDQAYVTEQDGALYLHNESGH